MPEKCECLSPVFMDRVDIEQDSREPNDPQPVYTGPKFKRGVPCQITTTAGDETFHGRQLDARVSHVLEMRYFEGVDPTMRITVTAGLYAERILNIRFVKPIRKPGKPPMQWLYCEEGP